MEKKRKGYPLLFTLILFMFLLLSSVPAAAETKEPSLGFNKMFFFVGGKYQFSLENAPAAKVKWKTTNTRIATVNKKGKVTAKKIGSCKLIATYDRKKYKCSIVVKSNKAFLKTWCKDLGAQIKEEFASPFDRVIAAAMYISTGLNYGSASGAFDALKRGRGTCVSGNALLTELLKAMGYKAKLRFAANDRMNRYPKGLYFASQHHNVRVTIGGKTYYVDGTPEAGIVYLSSETEPVYCAYQTYYGWMVDIDNLPG